MSMCRIFSCVVGRGCLLWPVCSLGKTLLAFALLHSVFQGQICLLLQVFLDFLLFLQIWPWNTEWSRAKTDRVLPRKCTDHNKHPLPTTQEKALYMDITRWSTLKSDWLYSLQPKMETLYTIIENKTADCGSDHELLIAKFRLKLKKVGKSARPWRYDLNEIP